MSKIKSLALKLPYPLLNAGRSLRGWRRKNKARNIDVSSCAIEHLAEAVKRGFVSKAELHESLLTRGLAESEIIKWAVAFDDYRTAEGLSSIKLLWADGPAPGNFGDWLSPYIVQQLTASRIELVDDYAPPREKHLVAIGSLAPAINSWAHVIGAGAAHQNASMNPKAKYHSVRGPFTAKVLKKSGGPRVENFGDLGYLLCRVYKPKTKKVDAKVVLVRHMNHAKRPIVLPEGVIEISITAASRADIENFIDTLYSVGQVVTSAMHCFIACQSYGIPCALVNFDSSPGAVYGDGTKYLDAMEGVGLRPRLPTLIPFDFPYQDFGSIVYEDRLSDSTICDLEKHALSALRTYTEA